jgi:4-hydroxy-3-methylbut-2-enyl diphosphate reductase
MAVTSERLTVVTALRMERNAVSAGVTGATLVHCGPGRARAARAAGRLPGDGPVAVAGVAGGCAPHLRPGDVVVATEVRDVDQQVHPCPSAGLLVAALRRRGLRVHAGPMATATRPVLGPGRRRLARDGVLAVDMESGPVVAAARAAGRPVAVLRVVADAPGRPLLAPTIVRDGRIALRTLAAASGALADWAAAASPREVLLAGPRSFCAGVERAIEVVERALERYGSPVYVRKQIVHNSHVVADLERRGAVFVDELDEVPDRATVVFSAHGVAPAVWTAAHSRGLQVIDATGPLVSKVHAEARRFHRRGDTVLLIGHAGHEEVEGTLGEAPGIRLVQDVEDARKVEVGDGGRVSYLMQTTLAADEAADIVAVLQERLPALRGPSSDDICYATTNRQQAVRAVAADADVVLVLGSPNSSNSRRLVEIGERAGCPAYLVEDDSAIDPAWLAGATRVAITAGASAPPALVERCVAALAAMGPVSVTERSVASENVYFQLPREVS